MTKPYFTNLNRIASGFGPDRVWRSALAMVVATALGACGPRADHTIESPGGAVNAVAFSPDSTRLIMAGGDQAAHVIRVGTWASELTFRGASGPITALEIGRTDQSVRVLTGGDGPLAQLWSLDSEAPLRSVGESHAGMTAAVIAPGGGERGAWAATGGFSDIVRIYPLSDGGDGAEPRELDGGTMALSVSPDGALLLTTYLGAVRLWNTETFESPRTLEADPEDQVLCAAFAPDGKSVAAGHQSGALRIWSLTDGAPREIHKGKKAITALAFAPDGNGLAFASADGVVRMASVVGERIDQEWRCGGEPRGVAISPDGAWLAVGVALGKSNDAARTGRTLVWSLGVRSGPVAAPEIVQSAASTSNATGHNETDPPKAASPAQAAPDAMTSFPSPAPAVAAAETPAGDSNSEGASAGGLAPNPVNAGAIIAPVAPRAAPPSTVARVPVFTVLKDDPGVAVRRVAFSPNGKLAFVASGAVVTICDTETGDVIRDLEGHTGPVTALAVGLVGGRIVTAAEDHTIRLWEIDTGREIASIPVGDKHGVTALTLSRDGARAISAGSEGALRQWDIATGRELAALVGHTDVVAAVGFAPDGRRALSASLDGTVRLWFAFNGAEIRSFDLGGAESSAARQIWDAAFSSDGDKALTVGGDKIGHLWDIETGREIGRLEGHERMIRSAAISLNGERAITGGPEREARVWDLKTRAELHRLDHGEGGLMSVAISGDGAHALTGGMNGAALIWSLEPGK